MRVVRREKYGEDERAVYEYIAESRRGSRSSVRFEGGNGVGNSNSVRAVISYQNVSDGGWVEGDLCARGVFPSFIIREILA